MAVRLVLVFAVFASVCGPASSESPARTAGRAVGQFGAGVGEAVGGRVSEAMAASQPEWITVPPRGKDACLAESWGSGEPPHQRDAF